MSLSKLVSHSSSSDSDLESLLSQVKRKRVRKRLFRSDLTYNRAVTGPKRVIKTEIVSSGSESEGSCKKVSNP